jgi:hypothetical protein
MTTTQQTERIECGKCEGRGRLWWWGHRDQGVCYWCKGTGELGRAVPRAARDIARMQAAHTLDAFVDYDYAGARVTRGIWDRNPTYWAAMARRAAGYMLTVADTAWARKQLAQLDPWVQAQIIAAGRELKAERAA